MTEQATPQDTWNQVDAYLASTLLDDDVHLSAALAASSAAGLPEIQVSAPQGALLEILVRMQGGRRVLELGTLGGYSSLWMARGLANQGQIVSLEVSQLHADTACASFERAGRSNQIEVRVAPARDSLAVLRDEIAAGATPFDLVFIDADKGSMPQYFVDSLHLVRAGGVIVADNVVRGGMVVDDQHLDDVDVAGVRGMFDLVGKTPGVVRTAVQTVGSKGYDGFALVYVIDPQRAGEFHRDS